MSEDETIRKTVGTLLSANEYQRLKDGLQFIQLVQVQRIVSPVPEKHPTWLAPSVEGKELFIGVASVVQWRPAEPPAEAKTEKAVVL